MKIKNVKVAFLEESIIKSGYPMQVGEPEDLPNEKTKWISKIEWDLAKGTENKDYNRAKKLANTPSGSGHDNFLKGIIVTFDLQYPEYFSPQLQRYNWIDIISSQSKMHRITSRKLTKEDFTKETSDIVLYHINDLIQIYKEFGDDITEEEPYLLEDQYFTSKSQVFNAIISNLPSGYLKWMGISTNYLQLKTIYNQRCKHKHKLDEWRIFGEFIQSLPMQEFITGKPLK